MCDRTEQSGPFPHGAAEEVYSAIFGHDPVDAGSGRYDSSAWGKLRDNLAYAFGCDAGHGDDRNSALAPGSPEHKIELSTAAAEDFRAYGIGTNLSGKVNLEGAVDSHHRRIPGDYSRIIGG